MPETDPNYTHTFHVGSHVVSVAPSVVPTVNDNWLRPSSVRDELQRRTPPRRDADDYLVGLQGRKRLAKANGLPDSGGFPISHVDTYAQIFQLTSKTYFNRFDEALRHSRENARAMEADPLIYSLCQRRFIPTCILAHQMDVEDPDNIEQVGIARQLERMIESITGFHFLKRQLDIGNFHGRSGLQMLWEEKNISGIPRMIPRRWLPIFGDKIVYGWDHTPGMYIRSGSDTYNRYKDDVVEGAEYAPVLMFRRPELRDSIAIHTYEPSDTDFLFEGQSAGGVHGLGLRSRVYWAWFLRTEGLSYVIDALQRVSTMGMTVGYYPSGNSDAQNAVLEALLNLYRDNFTTFPREAGSNTSSIEHLEPGNVAYDVLFRFVEYLDEMMLLSFLGQTLTSQAGATGLGSKVAELHSDTKAQIIKYDAISLAETIENEIVAKMIRMNRWSYNGRVIHGEDLPFGLNFRFQTDDTAVMERIQAAEGLAGLGIQFDGDPLRRDLGFASPKDPRSAVGMPQQGQPNPMDPMSMVGTGAQAPEGLTAEQTQMLGMQQPPPSGASTFQMPGMPQADAPVQYHREGVVKYARPSTPSAHTATFGFWLPPSVAKTVACRGGTLPEDLCLNLVTVPLAQRGQRELQLLYTALRRVANRWRPLVGKFAGLARFEDAETAHDDSEVISAILNCPGVPEVRSHLLHVLERLGLPVPPNPLWMPAVPLARLGREENPHGVHLPAGSFSLGPVVLRAGHDKWSLPLQGSRVAKYSREAQSV